MQKVRASFTEIKCFLTIIGTTCCMMFFPVIGKTQLPGSTERIAQFSNDVVSVWKTHIFPNQHQILSMHRHDHDRVLVALTDGTIKVTNQQGKIHYLHLKKDTAYFLKRDVSYGLHTDENIGEAPIKVMVIELKH